MIVGWPDLVPCVVQTYQGEDGRWWRYCLTCDDGSNKYGRHTRGHKTERDALMSKRDHERAAPRVRQLREFREVWRQAMLATVTWDDFCDVMSENPVFHRVDWARQHANPDLARMAMIQATYREGDIPVADLFARIVM